MDAYTAIIRSVTPDDSDATMSSQATCKLLNGRLENGSI